MQEKATIARPYARAAFEQARQEGRLKEWSEMLRLLGAVVSDERMHRVIHDPRVDDDTLFQLVSAVCGDKVSGTGANFVKLLIQAGRLDTAAEVCSQFEEKRAREQGIAEVEVISAFELDGDQRKTLADLMQKRLGREVQVEASVDSSIIGGVVIRAGDSVIDASLRGRLRRLGNEFAK